MIYIKDMDMPVDCLACWVSCKHESYMVIGRPEDCPMEEAKDGDLISRADAIEAVDGLKERPQKYYTQYNNALSDAVLELTTLPSADAVSREEYENQERVYENQERVNEGLQAIIDNYKRDYIRFSDAYKESAEDVQGDGKMIPIELKKRYPHSRDEDITDAFMRGYKSAQAVQGWIPCSERLPDVDVEVLATVDWSDVRIAWLMKGGAWETDEYILGSDEILAWMPLPTPYKGGDDE